MKFEIYSHHSSNQAVIVGPELPHGFSLPDPCYPCIRIDLVDNRVTPGFISVSDDFWAGAYIVRDSGQRLAAVETAGGEENVKRTLTRLVERWKQQTAK